MGFRKKQVLVNIDMVLNNKITFFFRTCGKARKRLRCQYRSQKYAVSTYNTERNIYVNTMKSSQCLHGITVTMGIVSADMIIRKLLMLLIKPKETE